MGGERTRKVGLPGFQRKMPSLLDYPTPPPLPPHELTLDEVDGSVRARFPVTPKWVHMTNIFSPLFQAAVGGMVVVGLIWLIATPPGGGRRNAPLPPDLHHTIVLLAGFYFLSATVYLLISGLNFRAYLRRGKVPRTVLANRQGVTDTWPSIWRMGQRFLSAEEATGISVKPIRGNLTARWNSVSKMYVYRKHGRRWLFILPFPEGATFKPYGDRRASHPAVLDDPIEFRVRA
jgi:hypothetical protein